MAANRPLNPRTQRELTGGEFARTGLITLAVIVALAWTGVDWVIGQFDSAASSPSPTSEAAPARTDTITISNYMRDSFSMTSWYRAILSYERAGSWVKVNVSSEYEARTICHAVLNADPEIHSVDVVNPHDVNGPKLLHDCDKP